MGYPTARSDFIATGFNDRANHRMLLRELEDTLPLAARHGVPNVIAMFGNRRGKNDGEAIDNCVAGLNANQGAGGSAARHDLPRAPEQQGGSRGLPGRPHGLRGRRGQSSGSPRVRLLYDIYHMQIMEGDIIRTIRENRAWIATSTPVACPAATSWTARRS